MGSVERMGNQKHYRANKAWPIFEELKSIALKPLGTVRAVETVALAPFKNIQGGFVYGEGANFVHYLWLPPNIID